MLTLLTLLLISLAQTTPTPATPAGSSEVMTPDDPRSRMDLAEKVNGLRGMDIPWHLKATYEVLADYGTPSDSGTYEEWRVSAFTTDPTEASLFRLAVEPNERNGLRSSSRLMVDKLTTVPKLKVGEQIGRLDDEDVVRLNLP